MQLRRAHRRAHRRLLLPALRLQAHRAPPLPSQPLRARRRFQLRRRQLALSRCNQEVNKLRHKCFNSLHASAVVLANSFSNQVVDAMLFVCNPVTEWFDLSRTKCKTVRGSVDWRSSWADGKFSDILMNSVNRCFGADIMNDLRFVPAPDINIVAEESIVQDEKLAELVLDLAMNLCRSFLMSSMTWSHRLPGYFASLIEATGVDLQSRLAVLQRWWHLLCNLEFAAVGDRWVKGFLRDLLWPSEGFVREVFLMLYELELNSLSGE